jgi:uncharacterized protein YndB with AHSA1/START domain
MSTGSDHERDTCVSRIIKAPRKTIYQAFVDPEALVAWLPPKGMKGHVYAFDAREGGAYRMSLTYEGPDHSAPGKTSEHADIVRGRFVKLIPDERIVQLVVFESEDPAFAGARWRGRHSPMTLPVATSSAANNVVVPLRL